MNGEILDRALSAYRAETSAGPDRSVDTLQRIVAAQERRVRWRPVVWVAAAVCSTVAAAAIRELPRLRASRAAMNPPQALAPAVAVRAPEPPAEPEVAPAPTPSVAVPFHRTRARRTAVTWRPPPAPLPSAPDDPAEAEDALFEAARDAHANATPEVDLAGWNRYLASYPDGRFAPEARYRRALDLARLGRENEALAAFLWFTENREGSYRRDDASRWIQALSAER